MLNKIIANYVEIMQGNLIAEQMHIPDLPCRFLFLFENTITMQQVINHMAADPQANKIVQFFACKTLAELTNSQQPYDFALGWHYIDGKQRCIFD